MAYNEHRKGRLTPMRRVAARRVAARRVASRCVHIGNSSGHAARRGAGRCVAAKVSCFKMDRVVSLALLCEEAEN